MGTVFTNDNCVTGGGSLICLTSGSCRCLCPPPAQHTHRNTHTAQVVLLLWGPQSVYTLKGQKASPHNANCSTLTGPCQVGTEIQIHTEMNRQWSGGGDPKTDERNKSGKYNTQRAHTETFEINQEVNSKATQSRVYMCKILWMSELWSKMHKSGIVHSRDRVLMNTFN